MTDYRLMNTQLRALISGFRTLLQIMPMRPRGVFIRPGLYVLRKTAMPSILIEMGFISNPAEAALMSEEPERFAQGIYQGILQYFGLL